MATAGTPVRRARSFHRVRAPLNEFGEPARSYHGRAMSSLSLKEHTRSSGDAGSSSSHASFPANREPSLPPACGTPVRRARSFQRVLSPRRERSYSLPAEGASSGSGDGVGGVEVTQDTGGGSGGGSSGAPFPSAGRPVRRAGSFQRVVYPRSSRRSPERRIAFRADASLAKPAPSAAAKRSAPPSRRALGGWGSSDEEAEEELALAPRAAETSAEPTASSIPLADWYDLLGYTLALCDGATLRRVARCSTQLRALAAETLRCPSWRARLSTEADVQPRVALAVLVDKALLLQREIAALRPGGRLVVFCLTKRQCDATCRALAARQRCAVLHSERRPAERARALEDWASGEVPLLVATGADALSGHGSPGHGSPGHGSPGHGSPAQGTSLVGLADVVLYYDFPRQMDEYARRTRDLSRRGFCGVAVSFLTSHDLRPLTPGFTQQARDDVERGMLALCVKGSPRTSVLLGKRDRLLAHRQMLGLLKERPVILALTGQRGGGMGGGPSQERSTTHERPEERGPLLTLCTSNLSLVPVERWDSLPNAPWPPFRVYDLCTGAWLSFAYEDVLEVRLPAVGDQLAREG